MLFIGYLYRPILRWCRRFSRFY